jgi:hypothetical protein
MVSDKLKRVIFKKMYNDLKGVEIIPYKDSIWFIDRKNKYWYFEYGKSGVLWWNYDFFSSFFLLFSMKMNDFEPIISEWVEEVLNCKVNTAELDCHSVNNQVEEVLNCKVNTADFGIYPTAIEVEEVLNCKVNTAQASCFRKHQRVEEVLNCKVNTAYIRNEGHTVLVEEVLNCEINTTRWYSGRPVLQVEEVLNFTPNEGKETPT